MYTSKNVRLTLNRVENIFLLLLLCNTGGVSIQLTNINIFHLHLFASITEFGLNSIQLTSLDFETSLERIFVETI